MLCRVIGRPTPELHQAALKHIERRHFYVRECVEDHKITVPYVNTLDNLSDFFTKPLQSKHFFGMRDAIMNVRPREGDDDYVSGGGAAPPDSQTRGFICGRGVKRR